MTRGRKVAAGIRRRELVTGAARLAALSWIAPAFGAGAAALEKRYSKRAIDLVRAARAVDLKHALTLNPFTLKKWLTDATAFTAEDKALFRSCGLKVIQTTLETVEDTLLDFAWHNGFVAEHGDLFARIDGTADIDRIGDGRIGIIFGCENSDHFRKLDDVDLYYSLGQRVSQLTYNSQNRLGAGATERRDGGLSDYGVAIVERMNEVGMAVDLSHCGDRTTLDAIVCSKKPVLFTHAAARALNPTHPRTKSDEAIRQLAARGGVMGIPFLRVFASDQEPTTIENVLAHFDHVIRLVGPDHVAVGSDIGPHGYDSLPREMVAASKANLKPGSYAFREKDDIQGLDHPRRIYDLTEGLIRRGHGDEVITGILGRNARRVLARIW